MAHLTRKRRGSTVSATSNSTSWTPTVDFTVPSSLDASIADGDRAIWVMVVAADGNGTLSETGGNGWTKINQASNGTIVTGGLWVKETTTAFASGAFPAFVLGNTASEQYSCTLFAYTAASGKLIGTITAASANGSSTNSNPASITNSSGAAQDVSVVVSRSGDSTTTASAAPTNYGNLIIQGGGGTAGASSNCCDRQLNIANSTSEDPGTFTSASEQWVCWTIGFYEYSPPLSLLYEPSKIYLPHLVR